VCTAEMWSADSSTGFSMAPGAAAPGALAGAEISKAICEGRHES
jgi:hypothetical protein